jgi:hypothetical protein
VDVVGVKRTLVLERGDSAYRDENALAVGTEHVGVRYNSTRWSDKRFTELDYV